MTHPNDTAQVASESARSQRAPWRVFTDGGIVHIDWDNEAPVTPNGQLPFFAEYLHVAGTFRRWCDTCPLSYSSNNAPLVKDVLGTMTVSVLNGHTRYRHIDTIHGDTVSAGLLDLRQLVSSDSARRAFVGTDEEACKQWQVGQLCKTYEALLNVPYVLDVDSSVKPLYGHQEGAVRGYNPKKPGRPSHAYHIYFIGSARVVLDVEVRPGNQTAGCYSQPGLWELVDGLGVHLRPKLIRGDVDYGNESMMHNCEERGLGYLFKVAQSQPVKRLVEELEKQAGPWVDAGGGWEGRDSTLRLKNWTAERRVVVLRRSRRRRDREDGKRRAKALPATAGPERQGQFAFMEIVESDHPLYEYAVLVTNLSDSILGLAQLYRDRADCENVIDELKNQWGWSGFTTKDLKRSQIMARIVCQVYNWWNIYCRLAVPDKHAEAITSRPLLWNAIGRLVCSGGQRLIRLSSVNARGEQIRQMMRRIFAFLSGVISTAAQLSMEARWAIILTRAFKAFLGKKRLRPPSEGSQLLLGI